MHIGVWWGRPEGKRQFGRLRHRWEDNIKTGVKEMGRGRRGLDLSGFG